MTKEELQKTVNMNNRFIKNQRDMKVCELLYQIVVIQCKKNGWNPTQFFQEGGYEMSYQVHLKDREFVFLMKETPGPSGCRRRGWQGLRSFNHFEDREDQLKWIDLKRMKRERLRNRQLSLFEGCEQCEKEEQNSVETGDHDVFFRRNQSGHRDLEANFKKGVSTSYRQKKERHRYTTT